MFKKTISAILMVCGMIIGAGAAETAFPVEYTGIDGETKTGYMYENGNMAVDFSYSSGGCFAECGLAAVENDKWQTAVVNRSGEFVVPYTDSPLSVEFSDSAFAFRYKDYSVYYTLDGNIIGAFDGAEGFFNDGLLPCKDYTTGLYYYVNDKGNEAFSGRFTRAGAFSDGRALVQNKDGTFSVIDSTGVSHYTLSKDVKPVYMAIFGGDTVVLSNGENQALYSLSKSQYLTGFVFSNISEFEYGAAMVRSGSLWGLISTGGKYLTPPKYYYLSYLGEGLYAARAQDGSASAVDASGNVIYRTPSYVSGFSELSYGLSWHGSEDGSLVFFKKNGGYFANLKNAENPKLLSENVVRVTQDNVTRYINLSNGKVLFEQPKTFDLGGGIIATTVHYEKFLGYQRNGDEYGWDVDFPEISGLADENIQKNINLAIRDFFLSGPSITAEYEALEGGYGASLEGSVLVIWANCVSGKGEGATVWNNNIAFNVRTGKQYQISDLLKTGYIDVVSSLLPSEHQIYMYNFPRMSTKGVTYYYNEYESETRSAHTESYLLTFWQLWSVVNSESDCYSALLTEYVPPEKTETVFSDVPSTHWAAKYIKEVYDRGLMRGSKGEFRPDAPITTAEVCVTIARSQKLEPADKLAEGVSETAWYGKELSAVISAGLAKGIRLSPESAMTREDAMQLFANILVKNGHTLPNATEANAALESFTDLDKLSGARRSAAALCVERGLLSGDTNGSLNPLRAFSRAEFAKLLVTVLSEN